MFDALSGSMAGFVGEEDCDVRRESFLDDEGGFDEAKFSQALDDTRRNMAAVLTFGPGVLLLSLALILKR